MKLIQKPYQRKISFIEHLQIITSANVVHEEYFLIYNFRRKQISFSQIDLNARTSQPPETVNGYLRYNNNNMNNP